jgi:hypothetical protein
LPWLAAGTAIGASTAMLLALPSRQHEFEELEDEPRQQAERQEQQDAGVADEESVGLADAGVEEVLASAVTTSTARVDPGRISREIPEDPLPGQRKPPCIPRMETTIQGACWKPLRFDAPCGDDYEWEGRCYTPSLNSPRQPTSDSEQ